MPRAINPKRKRCFISLFTVTTPGCQPSLAPQFDNTKPQRRERCRRVNQAAYALLRDRPEIRTVIVAGRWSSRYEPSNPAADLIKVETDIAATIDRLREIGKRVVVMGEVPRLINAPRSCVLKQLHLGVTIPDCGFVSRANLDPLGSRIWQSLKQMSERRTDVVFFAPQDHLCDAERCIALDTAGLPLYRDDDHLNSRGAHFLMPFIETAIAPLVKPSSVVSQHEQANIVSAVPAN